MKGNASPMLPPPLNGFVSGVWIPSLIEETAGHVNDVV